MIKIKIAVLLILFVLVVTRPAFSEQAPQADELSYSIHNIYLESESIGDEVYVTVQDKRGFIWIGTDNGIRKYDGYKFQHFNHDPANPSSLGSNFVFDIIEDSHGNLWFAGNKNISLYHEDTETFTVYDVTKGSIIRTLAEGPEGLIWFGGDKVGIQAIDPVKGDIVHEIHLEETARFDVRSIIADKNNPCLWIASGNGLFKLNTQNLHLEQLSLPPNFELGNETIRQALIDNQGNLWAATNQGILLYDPNSDSIKQFSANYSYPSPYENIRLVNDDIWSVFQDSDGAIWFGTGKSGLYRYNLFTHQFSHFASSRNQNDKFPPATIYNIFEDNQHSLWIPLNTFGVRRMSKTLDRFNKIVQSDGDENSLSLNNVLDIHEHSSGDIFIATDGGGLDRYNPQTGVFKHYRHEPDNPHSISSDSVISMAEDKLGQIWVGTWAGGLNLLNTRTDKFTRITKNTENSGKLGLANNNIFRIEVLPDGRLLLSVWTLGLQIYDPLTGIFESYFSSDIDSLTGIQNSAINDFEASSDGTYWLAGVNGLEKLDVAKREFTYYLSDDTYGTIYDVLTDTNGHLWLASSQGLTYFEPETKFTKQYTKKDGLSDNFVVSLEQDSNGDIWIGTRAGLNRFTPYTESFKVFDLGDGIAGMQFNRFSHLSAKNGDLYFGSAGGISVFNPSNTRQNEQAPDVVITSVELFQQPVSIGEDSILKKSIGVSKEIRLDYGQRDITFEFAALNFISPENNSYQYRLDGLEDTYTTVDSSRRRARYTNLDSGEYTFLVKGSNNDGVWNNQDTSISLIINKPWWETWWARFLFILFVLSCIKWQSDKSKRRRDILTQMVNEKTEVLNKVNSELAKASKVAQQLNVELEQRVEKRTAELSIEVEERRIAEAKMFHMAFHDPLTNLPNRQWLIKHLQDLLQKCQNNSAFTFALMFLDGDKFKYINDSRGHSFGDKVLIEAAQRLQILLPECCQAVRLGGDEFIVVVEGDITEAKMLLFGNKVISAFESPLSVENATVPFMMSIGIVICDYRYTLTEEVLRDADIAMYKAKETGRGLCQLFDENMREDMLETIELETDMLKGLENEEFFVVYQPIVNLKTRRVEGFEALARWQHPSKGLISPERFISLAEESGFILQIGEWVLNKALKQLKIWQNDANLTHKISMAVNLSAKQLSDVGLVDVVKEALASHHIDGKYLKLEITESALMENTTEVRRVLNELHTCSIDFAIDDFGTGYSSLAYLGQLPVQFLKIDRMFVSALTDNTLDNQNAIEIVSAIISLAHSLNVHIVAEGIETNQQRKILNDYDCLLGQGSFFSEPLDSNTATKFLLNYH